MNKYFCDICGEEIGHKKHVRFLEISQGDEKKRFDLCRQCEEEINCYIAHKLYEKQKGITNDR